MPSSARLAGTLLFATACATSVVPTAKVVANMSGGDFAPLAVGGGFVVSGNPLTVWRARQLQSRRSVREHPGALAVARDGHACATVAAAPAVGLRSYRLPGLDPMQVVGDACNDMVTISAAGTLVACAQRSVEQGKVQTQIRVFSFPDLKPVQSFAPLTESVEALSFVGAQDDQVAVAVTFVEPPYRADDYRSRIDLYDTRGGNVVGSLTQKGRFSRLAFAQQDEIFIWAGQSGIQAWSVRSRAQLKVFGATSHTIAVALSPDARLLAASYGEYAVSDQATAGGGTIQILDMTSGELLASFGSTELRAAASPHDDDEMLNERPRVRVQFELLGAPTIKNRQPVFGDLFGGTYHVANHETLAFVDNDTLFSAGRGFFALWTLNQAAILKARQPR